MIDFLSSPLVQTGLQPPVKVVADKATHKQWSNNLTGVLTIVPGSDHLIQGIFLDAPRCERSTGEALQLDWMEQLSRRREQRKQKLCKAKSSTQGLLSGYPSSLMSTAHSGLVSTVCKW